MSELEDLPSWAGRSADSQPSQEAAPAADAVDQAGPIEPGEPRRRRPWMTLLLALFGILALLGLGAVGFLLASNDDGTSETATDQGVAQDTTTDSQADAQLGSEEVVGGADGSGEAAGDEQAVTVEVDGDTTTDQTDGSAGAAGAAADETTDNTAAGGEVFDSGRQAIFRGGKVYLSGAVPSEEVGKLIEQKAAAVVGPDNVVNEYTIDPRAVVEPGSSAPLYVEDVVLFEFNSVEIAAPFLPILDLGTLLLRQNPQASVTVITRTDAVGSEAVNLQVSTARAQSVIEYWLSKGVNRDQIKADPRGEEMASDADDAATAAQNRRAEFIITGLLD